ncbi:MAG: hypothetical protein NT001_04390, partial [Candidatus Woesearchaeota archaeon]|nr:hypothetical protein [Candidatus Woesearchaeota archaeon]
TQYGNKEQAKKDADQALELYTEMGHLEKMARALSLRCAANAKKGDTQSIKQAYTDMEETLRLTDSILTEGNNTEGGNYTSHGGWTYSLRKILVHRINALQGGGDAMIVEGLHENALDKYQKAIDTLKLMGNIPHEEEDKGALAVAHLRKAHALSLIMDHEKEEECYNCYMIYVQGLNKGLVQPAAADVLKPCRDVVESYLTSRNLLSPHYPYPITPGTGFWG